MWHTNLKLRRLARSVVNRIADHRGGELYIYQMVKCKYPLPNMFQRHLVSKLENEIGSSPAEGAELYTTITRLLKHNVNDLAQDKLKYWLRIPQVPSSSRYTDKETFTI
jgi:hypothetical protein